jgi:cytochrome b561
MGKPKNRRYTPMAQTLHWLIVLLIVVQFVLARMAEHLPLGVRKLSLLAEHKSVGMTILTLSGWLMSSAKNYSVSWFGLFTWPNLVPTNEAAFAFFKALHDVLSDFLIKS